MKKQDMVCETLDAVQRAMPHVVVGYTARLEQIYNTRLEDLCACLTTKRCAPSFSARRLPRSLMIPEKRKMFGCTAPPERGRIFFCKIG
ncbi:MAG: hypothetical protein V8T36_10175 [Ruthenibacterium lactatiformans]